MRTTALRRVERRAAAKINLALHVTGRRQDGYHLLDSIAVFADFGDRVVVTEAEGLSLALSGPFAAHAPGDTSDLSLRAADAFFAHAGIGPAASIEVEKNIPAGAGLGGGSADAAAVLLALNDVFGAPLEEDELRRIALPLGADVPMCIAGKALRARGVGEEIEAVEGWPALPLVLVWPGKPVSTAEAFKSLARRDNDPLADPPSLTSQNDVAGWLRDCRNDLEAPALTLCPAIGDVLQTLSSSDGCLLARMSGSGSACFGLYANPAAADRATSAIKTVAPQWWVQAATAR